MEAAVTTRSELLIPDGWKPQSGTRVEVMPAKEGAPPPGGVWRVIDRGPSPSGWWLMPASDKARDWARRWPNAMTQGCIEVSGRLLVPPGRQT